MSTCISHNGEFSEHVYQIGGGAAFLCKRCWAFDDDAAMEEIDRLEGDLAIAVHEATEARAALAERDREAEASAARWRALVAAPVQPERDEEPEVWVDPRADLPPLAADSWRPVQPEERDHA